MRLLHVTDLHLSADEDTLFGGEPPWQNLRHVLGAIATRDPSAELLALGGDVADDGALATYQDARVLLDRLPMPRVAVPGNHDDRELLERHIVTDAGGPIAELRRLGWELHLLDSQIPGTVEGRIDEEQLAGLRHALRTSDAVAHLVVLHHDIAQEPGVGFGLLDPEPLLDVLLSSDARIVVLTGHRHTSFGVTIGRLTILVTPATSVQFNPRADGLVPTNPTMPGYRRLELGAGGHVTTEVVWVGDA
jgi:3',5'-cyclic-AMP phosphodiesterase